MAPLQLFLFGPPRLERDGQAINVTPRKAMALLAYLAVTAQPHSRDALATLFWPESDQAFARASLRRTLYLLQQALPQPLLIVTPETIRIDPEADLWVDVMAYQVAVHADLPAQSPRDGLDAACLDRLAATAARYVDDFMAGFTLDDCPEFDEWQFFQREGLRHSLGLVLHQLQYSATQTQQWSAAIDAARRRLALDPLHEPVHRDLMMLYVWAGQQAAALRQYQECRRLLQKELGAPPDPETESLYARIRTKQIPPPPEQPRPGFSEGNVETADAALLVIDRNGVNGNDKGWEQPPAQSALPTPRFAIPTPATTFVGRERELAGIIQTLMNPECRLLTLVGLGGIGKTRVAIQVAQRLASTESGAAPLFPDGIVFVHLAAVSEAAGVIPEIMFAAGWRVAPEIPLHQQLMAMLRPRRMLLVLDNFDHLLDAAELVSTILAHAPALKVLVTSRVAVPLAEAWFYPLGGMSFPPAEDVSATGRYEAVELFVQCARRARPDFVLERAVEPVTRICRLVTGMPLAIELAAAWLRALPVEAVASEISRGLDILSSRYANLPARHRSMRVVLEQSWALLDPAEREVFRRLAVMHGSFRLEAAVEIAGATLPIITDLVEKSLLMVEGDRYTLHELLRQFGLEKLQQSPAVERDAYARYSAYYLGFLEALMEPTTSRWQPAALAEIDVEADNILGSWQWLLAQGDLEALQRAFFGYKQYLWLMGGAQTGLHLFRNTLRALDESPTARSHPSFSLLHYHLQKEVGTFSYFLGQFDTAIAYLEAALAAAQQMGDRRAAADAQVVLGTIAAWQGRQAAAEELFEATLAAQRAVGNRDGEADVLHEISRLALASGDYARATRYSAESLEVSRALERPDWIAYALVTLGTAAQIRGEFVEADRLYREALEVFTSIHHQLGIAVTLGGQGWLVWAMGGPQQEAEELAQRSLSICRQIGHRLQTSHRLAQLAFLANDRGDYDAARGYAEEGTSLAAALGNPLFHTQNLCALAEAAYRQGDLGEAQRHLALATRLAADANFLSRLTMVAFHAGRVLCDKVLHAETVEPPDADLAARCLVWASRHRATWHVLRVQARTHLGRLRSVAPAAVDAAETGSDAALQQEIVSALLAWAASDDEEPLVERGT